MSLVCTTPQCTEGRAKVQGMWDTFHNLSANYPSFNASAYKASCDAIQAELTSVDYTGADWIPFNPVCCTIADIGTKAETLADQMLSSVGASPLPKPPGETDWITVAAIAGVILLLTVYSPQIKGLLK